MIIGLKSQRVLNPTKRKEGADRPKVKQGENQGKIPHRTTSQESSRDTREEKNRREEKKMEL